MVVHAFGINCDALILLFRMESLRLVPDWRRALLRLQEPRPLTVSANRSFSSLPIAVAACGATVSVVSSSLTVHSSRCRFAARLNSGVRLGKKQFSLLGRLFTPSESISAHLFYCFGWRRFGECMFAANELADVRFLSGGARCFGCKSLGLSLSRQTVAFPAYPLL